MCPRNQQGGVLDSLCAQELLSLVMYDIYRVSVLGISKRNKDTLGSGVDWESCCSGKNGFRDLKIPCQYTFVWCPRLLQSQGEHTKNS